MRKIAEMCLLMLSLLCRCDKKMNIIMSENFYNTEIKADLSRGVVCKSTVVHSFKDTETARKNYRTK